MRIVRRGLTVAGASIAACFVAGVATGLWSRVLMWILAATAPARAGEVTHERAVVGQRTLEGTINLVLIVVAAGAVTGAPVYIVVRRWLPARVVLKGLSFAAVLLAVFGPYVLDGDYEYFRYGHPAISVALFLTTFVVFGLVSAALAERWAGAPAQPPRRWLTIVGVPFLAALGVWGAARLDATLSGVYHLY
ncbi:MAG: hypothetical protein H0W70_06580 [Actinobacteria bacterium]|nr:hypothetical protein [Actinomycetota bacterium]